MTSLKSSIELVNHLFRKELNSKGIPLYEEVFNRGILYKGKLDFHNREVSFIISITDEEGEPIVQIVFHDLIDGVNNENTIDWLRFINDWNDSNGASYYLALSKKNRVYLRTIFPVEELSTASIFKTFVLGGILVNKLLDDMTH